MSPLHTTTYNEKYTEREYQPTFNYIRWSWVGKNLIASLSFNKVWKCKKPYKINKRTNKQTNKKQNSQHLQEQQLGGEPIVLKNIVKKTNTKIA